MSKQNLSIGAVTVGIAAGALLIMGLPDMKSQNLQQKTFLNQDNEGDYEFFKFSAIYNRDYPSTDEFTKRIAIFNSNYNMVKAHNQNKASSVGYQLGINEFADRTADEMQQLLGFQQPDEETL